MIKVKLQEEYARLLLSKDLNELFTTLNLLTDYIFRLGQAHHSFSPHYYHAGTMLQMFVTKNISLMKMLTGVGYQASNGSGLNDILDPTTIIPHIRTMYELLCTFELVYVLPNTEEKKLILYNLWCIAGLKNRQAFNNDSMNTEQKEQCEDEAIEIKERIKAIRETTIYNLHNNKKVIEERIDKKDYKLVIDDDNFAKAYGWKAIPQQINMNKGGVFTETYNYFSMYAHSSYIAAIQFDEMFKERDDVPIIGHMIKNAIIMNSVFISDYMAIFPETKDFFFKQDINLQMAIRVFAKMVRGYSNDLDEKWMQACNA